jgi:predicted HNH restriction endonuclease
MKKILILILLISSNAQALTLQQSEGMVAAQCAGTYFSDLVIADRQGLDREDELRSKVTFASGISQDLIGNVRTEILAESAVTELINAYERNAKLGYAKITAASKDCDAFLAKFQNKEQR